MTILILEGMESVTTRTKLFLFVLAELALQPALASQTAPNLAITSPSVESQQTKPLNQQGSFFSKFSPKRATIMLQLGGYRASQGSAQNIGIAGLIGDRFTVTQPYGQNVLAGLGYYVDGMNLGQHQFLFGLNAFYFAPTSVKGNVVQEQLFTNLAYRYSVTHYPIYFAAKELVNPNDAYTLTLDLGVGPNIMQTSNFSETSLDGGVTQPDSIFSGQTRVAFSATAGLGVRINHAFGHVPLEVGYRFFYLGQGSLNSINSQVTNKLNTGNCYANALVFSISD